ncbi:expressed protein isoform B [Chlorella sorokiniana]|uniref:Expressed protein isoform B n=1 Tax=Chlorella sorokiniana TaxID=3076 RepID=A0A2P6U1M5_CHLSO|nr:expressed protein isoform B [Chlorella sorokiniana]|eukprot:PRW60217.1 expressed protein isoform B [Chlorella sorokiniana]
MTHLTFSYMWEKYLKNGTYTCADQLDSSWQFIKTEEVQKDKTYVHTCRRCGLPRDAVLMWFGTAPMCHGSCPSGWQQVSPPVEPDTLRPDGLFGNAVERLVDPQPDSSASSGYINSKDFGKSCASGSPGKMLCALGGRPAAAHCSYTWRGTAPDCRDACEPGETLVAKDWYGDGKRCLSGTYNKMLCERCQEEILDLRYCTSPMWFGTAPLCAGECNVGDRVMARAQRKEDVPSDQDPGGFGKPCNSRAGWKLRCHQCSVKGLMGSGLRGQPACTASKPGYVWPGSPVAALSGVKTYEACCRECHDAPECRRFHVGPAGCFLFAESTGQARRVPAGAGRAGSVAWQTGVKRVRASVTSRHRHGFPAAATVQANASRIESQRPQVAAAFARSTARETALLPWLAALTQAVQVVLAGTEPGAQQPKQYRFARLAAGGNGSTGCAAERLHLSFLRHMLGVRQGTPNAVVLAETGERPLLLLRIVHSQCLLRRGSPDFVVDFLLAAPREVLVWLRPICAGHVSAMQALAKLAGDVPAGSTQTSAVSAPGNSAGRK